MKTSKRGIDMIIAFEGLELKAYKCPAGVWTIGVGHTGTVHGQPIKRGMEISRELAEWLLEKDLASVESYLANQPFAQRLKQKEFDALVSFIFNVGKGAFETSTMRKKLCIGAPAEEVADEFPKWVYGTINGKKEKLPGLVARRERERERFLES